MEKTKRKREKGKEKKRKRKKGKRRKEENKKKYPPWIEPRPYRISTQTSHCTILLCHYAFAAAATKCTKKIPLSLWACAYMSPWTSLMYFWHTYFLYEFPLDKPTYIYISCEVLIEHPVWGSLHLPNYTYIHLY